MRTRTAIKELRNYPPYFSRKLTENQNLYFTVVSYNPKVGMEQIVETLASHCPSVSMKRFDETKEMIEASFLVEFDDFD